MSEHQRLRDTPVDRKSLAIIALLIIAVSLFLFALVSFSEIILPATRLSEISLIAVVGLLLGIGVYHAAVYVYDREGAIYPLFTLQILFSCLGLLSASEAKTPFLLPAGFLSAGVLRAVSVIALITTAVLIALFSVLLLRPKKRLFDAGDRLYSVMLCVCAAIEVVFLLPIPAMKALLMPQVLPIVMVTLMQSVLLEGFDEHYLAGRYVELLKVQQELLSRNEALESVEAQRRDMMAILSHETRTPLAVISNYASLIAAEMRHEGVSEGRARDLDGIADQIQIINDIMRRYMSMGKGADSAEEVETVSVSEVVIQTVSIYRHIATEAGMTLTLSLHGELSCGRIEPGKLTQVLLNLIKNAARHSRGKRILVSGEDMPGFVRLTVSDDGCGFSPAPPPGDTFPAKRGGGIGLAICRQIVDECGGELTIQSDPGAGTEVSFTIPSYP